MPQEIRVLCCLKCKMYQVDIVKKAKKWQCKLCGEKQSVFREFFRGTGVECRQKAQEFNFTANSKQTAVENELLDLLERDDLDIDLDVIANEERKLSKENKCKLATGESKWTAFLETTNESPYDSVNVKQFNNSKRKVNSHSEISDMSNQISSSASSSKWSAFL